MIHLLIRPCRILRGGIGDPGEQLGVIFLGWLRVSRSRKVVSIFAFSVAEQILEALNRLHLRLAGWTGSVSVNEEPMQMFQRQHLMDRSCVVPTPTDVPLHHFSHGF